MYHLFTGLHVQQLHTTSSIWLPRFGIYAVLITILSAEITTDLFRFVSRNKILISINIVQTKVWHGKGCDFFTGSRRTSLLPSLATNPASVSASYRKDSKGYRANGRHGAYSSSTARGTETAGPSESTPALWAKGICWDSWFNLTVSCMVGLCTIEMISGPRDLHLNLHRGEFIKSAMLDTRPWRLFRKCGICYCPYKHYS